jgi:hypothetical protein
MSILYRGKRKGRKGEGKNVLKVDLFVIKGVITNYGWIARAQRRVSTE